MERKGRDRGGLKEWAGIEDVARGSNRIMQPPGILSWISCWKSFPQRRLGTPGRGRPDAGSKPQPAGLGGDSFPNSRIRPSIALPVNADNRYRSMIREIHEAGLRMFLNINDRIRG